jgi:cbb3-type cytochrome oxidase maturation protein
MEIVNLLAPLALILGLLFLVGFIWMTVSGQYDDLETPASSMLFDLEENQSKKNQMNINQSLNQKRKNDERSS